MTASALRQRVLHNKIVGTLTKTPSPETIHYYGNIAQGKMLRDLHLIEATADAAFVEDQVEYAYTDSGWEFLAKAIKIKYCKDLDGDYRTIAEKSRREVDEMIHDAARYLSTADGTPRFFYNILGTNLGVGFYATPGSATNVRVVYVRGHVSTDDISDDVDPLIPDHLIDAFAQLTTLELLKGEMLVDPENKAVLAAVQYYMSEYEALKIAARARTELGGGSYNLHRKLRV